VAGSPYPIVASAAAGTGLTNYTISYTNGSLTVNRATLTVTPNNQQRQYSDPNPQLTGTITGVVAGDGITSSYSTTATTSSIIGTYPIAAALNDPNSRLNNYAVTLNSGILTVTQEDARTFYTGGSLFFATSVNASTATVTLSATVKDITPVDPSGSQPIPDTYSGDIRTARVAFVDRTTGVALTNCASMTPSLVSSSDLTVGTVVCLATLSISNSGGSPYEIGIRVGSNDSGSNIGNYSRNVGDEDTTVVVALPLTSAFITGGGYLVNPTNTAGTYAGDANRKTNFGFNVKYNKAGTNLQGNVHIIDRKGSKVFQFKSNSLTSLGVQYWDTTLNSGAGGWALVPGGTCANNFNASAQCPIAATFQGKANLNDVTLPTAISLGGNLTLQMALTDKGEPGSFDTLAITVWNGNSLLLSSMWNGTQTAQKTLDGGNLVAH
jgi:hypothetical protein